MKAPPKTRIKAKAQLDVPQTRDEAAIYIRNIGDRQRELLRYQTQMNDRIAEVTEAFQSLIDEKKRKIAEIQEGLQSWCEANRDELTNGGKVKTANLITGEISWRQRPPSVRITGAESVIQTLLRLGLSDFVRTKEEVNKEAILNSPDDVKGVAGITVVTGVEDFVITPFEQTDS